MPSTIVLLIDDSEMSEKFLQLIATRIREIMHSIENINFYIVYLYSNLNKPILKSLRGLISGTCYCFQSNEDTTNFQELSRIIYKTLSDTKADAIFSSNSKTCKECMATMAYLFKTGLAADCNGLTLDFSDNKFCFERTVGEFPPKTAIVKVDKSFPQMATFVDVDIDGSISKITAESKDVIIVEVAHNCRRHFVNSTSTYLNTFVVPQYKTYLVLGAGISSYDLAERTRVFAQDRGIGFGITKQILNRGWYDESLVIGISGKTIAPNVCIEFGVSGAYQHYIGVKDSKYIISINNDVSAPIVGYAHKTMISDVNEVIEELTKNR